MFSNDPEEPEVWFEQKGDRFIDVVEHLTGAGDEDIALAVTNQLIADDFYWPGDGEEPFYDDEFLYERTKHCDGGNERLWQRFCTAVVHERRFFNDDARDALRAIFKDIHLQRDTTRDSSVYLIDPAVTPTTVFRPASFRKVSSTISSPIRSLRWEPRYNASVTRTG